MVFLKNNNNSQRLPPFPGLSFIALAEPAQQGVPDLLRKAHALYADYALKNPFYAIDMPIK